MKKKYTAASPKEVSLAKGEKQGHKGFGLLVRGNSICPNGHPYSSRGGYRCPICREPLTQLGDKWRIGKSGKFDKKEK